MAKATILFAENDPDYLKTKREILIQEGYRVIEATNPTEARTLLEQREFDLAILDIRLVDDEDQKDISGLTIAKEVARIMPKIILTGYPTMEVVREALRTQLDGLPPAVEFVSKREGTEVLIGAIHRALGPHAAWMRQVTQAIAGTDKELDQDYNRAQIQSIVNFLMSVVVSLLGVLIIFAGIALLFFDQVAIGIASAVGGIVTEAVSYLFFQREDAASDRMERYRRERLGGRYFKVLLQACEGLGSGQKRERCREQVIMAATKKWLGESEASDGFAATKSLGDKETDALQS